MNMINKYLLLGCTSTCNVRFSPTVAELTVSPVRVTIFIEQTGGGPVLAIVPAVVSIDTLNARVTFFSPVWYIHLIWKALALDVTSFKWSCITRTKLARPCQSKFSI